MTTEENTPTKPEVVPDTNELDESYLGLTEEEALALKEAEADDKQPSADEETPSEEPETQATAPEAATEPKPEQPKAAQEPAPTGSEASYQPTEPPPPTFAEQMATVDEKLAKLGKDLTNGEVDISDYHQGLTTLMSEKNTIQLQASQAQIMMEMSQRAAQQEWEKAQATFFQENPAYKDSKLRQQVLSTAIDQLTEQPDAQNKPYSWFLEEGKKIVDAEFTGAVSAKTPKKVKSPPPELPQTLSNIPASAPNQTSNNDFAHLDNLGALELEAAMSKMTDGQRDKYLRAA